jgi:hypothetical protein
MAMIGLLVLRVELSPEPEGNLRLRRYEKACNEQGRHQALQKLLAGRLPAPYLEVVAPVARPIWWARPRAA